MMRLSLSTLLVASLALTPLASAHCPGGAGCANHRSFVMPVVAPGWTEDVLEGTLPPRHVLRRVSDADRLRDADRTFRDADRTFRTILQDFFDDAAAAQAQAPSQEEVVRMRMRKANATNENAAAHAAAVAPREAPKATSVELRLRPSFEWKETVHGLILTGATPGLAKEDLTVEIVESGANKDRHSYIIVSGETTEKKPAAGDKLAVEFRVNYSKFEQRVKLPAGVDKDTLSAKYENGMLHVFVAFPKKEEPKKEERKKIAIA